MLSVETPRNEVSSTRISLCDKINIQNNIDGQANLRSDHIKRCCLFSLVVFNQLQRVSRSGDDGKNKKQGEPHAVYPPE